MMESLPAVLGDVAKPEGVLKAIYSDLAAPGVRQVGKALGTVLRTGNILLLPLRMLNEYAANFERKNFEQIADRFSNIPEGDIVDVRPEIGVPILEKLSATHDPDLRKLFVELLASAANGKKVGTAHPSFVRVIESLSPDEARLLKAWKTQRYTPILTISKMGKDGSSLALQDLVMVPPASVTADLPMLSAYVTNMAGLGLLSQRQDTWLTEDGAYDQVIEKGKDTYPDMKEFKFSFGDDGELDEGDIVYNRGIIEILSYGRLFQFSCID